MTLWKGTNRIIIGKMGIFMEILILAITLILFAISCHSSGVYGCYLFPADMPDPCADKACLFGSRCVASADGLHATCECPASCPSYGDSEDSQPVCGSDGKYYRNKCELDREACRLRKNITARFFGKCGKKFFLPFMGT